MPEAVVDLIRTVDLNIFSVVVLVVILAFVPNNFTEHQRLGNRLFIILVNFTLVLTLLDIFCWYCEGRPGQAWFLLNKIINLLLFSLSPAPALIWLLYVVYNLSGSRKKMFRLVLFFSPVWLTNLILVLLSLQTGWYFTINAANKYVRGPLFALHLLPHYLFLVVSVYYILANKKKEDPLISNSLLFFVLPPLIGTVLQSIFYGLILYWPSVTLSILIFFIRVQSRNLFTDPLTGAYNRRHFERIINYQISRASHYGLALIIADLDDFKQVNDTYGHSTGDAALLQAVQLFRKVLRQDDLIARFSGDEFYILLDLNDDTVLQEKVRQIENVFAHFSSQEQAPYQLQVSMGAAIYDSAGTMSAAQFINHVDQLMYAAKARKKKAKATAPTGLP